MNQEASPEQQLPVWSTVGEDVLCPLCEYNLRGVSEPRCPECGYQFEWQEVLDPRRRLHRYLFEHHPERNVWSFRKTLIGGLLPRPFWRGLYPVQPVNPERLRRYWLIVSLVYIVFFLAIFVGLLCLEVHTTLARNRASIAAVNAMNPSNPPKWVLDLHGSYKAYKALMEREYPTRLSLSMVVEHIEGALRNGKGLLLPLLPLLWPILTLGALLVFRISMRRAKIRPAHVLRCVVYSFDGLFWSGPVFMGFAAAGTMFNAWRGAQGILLSTLAMLLFVLGLHMLYRLVTAYRLYLRFDHPILTILASQVIVALAMLKLVALFTIDLT